MDEITLKDLGAKALTKFQSMYPSVTSGDLQTFTLGYNANDIYKKMWNTLKAESGHRQLQTDDLRNFMNRIEERINTCKKIEN